MGLQDFHGTFKLLFVVYLKYTGYWPSADVKLMSNDLMHAMHLQCMIAFSFMYTLIAMVWPLMRPRRYIQKETATSNTITSSYYY